MPTVHKIGLGGGCHWCTEAVYQSLKGVIKVEQGFIASSDSNASYSEAVIVHYDAGAVSLKDLIAIHLHTHKSSVAHSMRSKYRSAIYTFNGKDADFARMLISELQADFNEELITLVLPFKMFKPSDTRFHDYYFSDQERPFCQTYIEPKLKLLAAKFSNKVKDGLAS